MLVQSYSFALKYDIVTATSGALLSGIKTSVLVCVTTIGKVLLYSPSEAQLSFLNMNREIRSLDVLQNKLILASENTLISYDIENNFEEFYKDVPDGISALCCGQYLNRHLSFIGGNCSISGFNEAGEEDYWNVASDEVNSILVIGNEFVIVSTIDNIIRIYKKEEILYQLSTRATCLNAIIYNDQINIVVAQENGQLMMYREQTVVWKDDSDITPVQNILFYDNHIIIYRTLGSLELRTFQGAILQKMKFDFRVISLMEDDLRGIGSKQIVIILSDGTVKGFNIVEKIETIDSSDQITALQQQKIELQQQIELYQNNSIIGPKEKLQIGLKIDKTVDIMIKRPESGTLQQILLFSDILYKEGLLFVPNSQDQQIKIPLKLKQQHAQVQCKLFILDNQTNIFHIITVNVHIPRFGDFLIVNQDLKIESQVECKIKERITRYVKWIDQCFIIETQQLTKWEQSNNQFSLNAIQVGTGLQLQIVFNQLDGVVVIRCDDMGVCGNLIQDLCNFLQMQELSTSGTFPKEVVRLKEILTLIEQQSQSKNQLNADLADCINQVKQLIVTGEDSRQVGDIQKMQKTYAAIMVQNKMIQSELLKKTQNTDQLMQNLKELNSIINKAADLRLGQAKGLVTTLCRNAIKKKNLHSLIEIIQLGREQ